jgi:cytochrome c-type biogenesis protein CcmH
MRFPLKRPDFSPSRRTGWRPGAACAGAGWLRLARHGVFAILIALAFAFLPFPAFAVDPEEQLKDPVLEARAREISAGLRCLVCQNQSIDDSDASLAKDLRLIVRQRLQKGETDAQAVDYIVARYGEFVLLKPRLNARTLLLWLAPVLLVAAGIALAARIVRRQPEARPPTPLTPEEEKELEALLKPKTQHRAS